MTEGDLRALAGLIGLSQRAGRLTTGADMVLKSIRARQAHLVLLDSGASQNTQKRVTDACHAAQMPLFPLPEGLLETACGRDGRVMAALTDKGFAQRIHAILTARETPGPSTIMETNQAKCGGASVE